MRENKKAIETLQYLPFMVTLQSVQVQPGQIQWPKLNLPNMADLGAYEGQQEVEEEEEEDYSEDDQPDKPADVEIDLPGN